jgi:hypothetical protein
MQIYLYTSWYVSNIILKMTHRGSENVAVNLLFYKVVFLTVVNLPLFIYWLVGAIRCVTQYDKVIYSVKHNIYIYIYNVN